MFVFTRPVVVVSVGLMLAGAGLSLAGCRKKTEAPPAAAPPAAPQAAAVKPAAPPLPDIKCPDSQAFSRLEPSKERVLFIDCTVFAPGRYWLGTALSYEAKTGKDPRMFFLTGGVGPNITVFDVEPLPGEEITKLVRASRGVSVKIRKTRGDAALVRLGVHGNEGPPEKPQVREVGLLLQLVAHAPPKVLWVGNGDQSTVAANGCLEEQVVDFELLFRTRLERFTTNTSRPAPGNQAASCPTPGPSMQESVAYQAVALKKGRPLGGEAAGGTVKTPGKPAKR